MMTKRSTPFSRGKMLWPALLLLALGGLALVPWRTVFNDQAFMPHGHCYLWLPGMVWLHASSDALTALAFYIIPLALLRFIRKRQDVAFHWMFVCFAVFIIACGTTHVMEVITIWSPYYWVSGIIKAITAVASVLTAFLLVFLVIPVAITLPSPEQLQAANRALEAEIRERKLAEQEIRRLNEELEQRVAVRTADLHEANQELRRSIEARKHIEANQQVFLSLSQKLTAARTALDAARQIAADSDTLFHWDALSLDLYSTRTDLITAVMTVDLLEGQRREVPPAYDHAAPSQLLRQVIQAGPKLILRENNCTTHLAGTVPFGDTSRRSASLMFAPIHKGAEVLGIVSVQSYRPQAFSPDDLKLLQALADQCGAALERVQVETELHASQEQYRRIVDTTHEGIWVIDKEAKTTFVNRRMADMLGYAEAEMQGQSIFKFMDEAAQHEAARNFDRRAQGVSEQHDFRFRRKNGGDLWAIVTTSPLLDDHGQFSGALDMVTDITDRKRTEDALRRSERRFAKIFHSGPVSIGMTTISDGRFIDVNHRHCQLFGGTREDTIGRTVGELNLWADPKQREQIVSAVREKGHCDDFEARLRCRSGEIRDVLMAMEIIELQNEPILLTMLIDITDRKRTEQALTEAEAKFRTVVEQAIVGIYIVQGDRFTYVNPRLTEILGRSAEEITSVPLLELIHPDDRLMSQEKVRLRLEGAIQSAHYQLRMLRPNGEVVHVEAHGGRIHYNGQTTIIGTLLDITERKRAEAEIRQLNEELEQRVIKRTAELQLVNHELEAFAYSVSHDLRAPLRGIDGFSQALQEDYGDKLDENGKKCLARVRFATQRMGQLIDDLLALSRVTRTSLTFQTIDLSALAVEVVAELQQENPERQVAVSLQPGLTTTGDARLLRIVLYNLLGNAWKFTRHTPAPRIEFGKKTENGADAFYVRDNGAGFDMAYTSKLFGAFQRLHSVNEYEGTGIGLATVQRIVHRHHGKIWAEGAVNQGATFYFTLPGKEDQS